MYAVMIAHAEGVQLHIAPTEAQLLLAWRDWLRAADPDAISTFQVGGAPATLPSCLLNDFYPASPHAGAS